MSVSEELMEIIEARALEKLKLTLQSSAVLAGMPVERVEELLTESPEHATLALIAVRCGAGAALEVERELNHG